MVSQCHRCFLDERSLVFEERFEYHLCRFVFPFFPLLSLLSLYSFTYSHLSPVFLSLPLSLSDLCRFGLQQLLSCNLCRRCSAQRCLSLQLGGQSELTQRAFIDHIGNVLRYSRLVGPTLSRVWNYTFVVQSLLLNVVLILVFDNNGDDENDLLSRLIGNTGWSEISESSESSDINVGLLKLCAVVNAATSAVRVYMRWHLGSVSASWAAVLPTRATEVNSVLQGMANSPRLGYEIWYCVWSTAAVFLNLLIPFLLVEVAIGSFSMQLVGKAVWNDKVPQSTPLSILFLRSI